MRWSIVVFVLGGCCGRQQAAPVSKDEAQIVRWCRQAARAQMKIGRVSPDDEQREPVCQDDAEECFRAGEYQRAEELARPKCEAGDKDACALMIDVEINRGRYSWAITYAESACKAGAASGCEWASDLIVCFDRELARSYAARACELDAATCDREPIYVRMLAED